MSVIYQPKGRAGEYSKWACNIYSGCGHKCAYCYAPSVVRMRREDFHANPRVRDRFFKQLNRDVKKHTARDPVLLCFTSDPYQQGANETGATRRTIVTLHAYDIPVTILTKGGNRSMVDFDILRPGDIYATSLTFIDYNWHDWEPDAASPFERINALEEAKKLGLETWVSFEPVIRPSATLEALKTVAGTIDHCKVGPLNYANRLPPYLLKQVVDGDKDDWATFAKLFQAIADRHNVDVYFKEDLQKLLT